MWLWATSFFPSIYKIGINKHIICFVGWLKGSSAKPAPGPMITTAAIMFHFTVSSPTCFHSSCLRYFPVPKMHNFLIQNCVHWLVLGVFLICYTYLTDKSLSKTCHSDNYEHLGGSPSQHRTAREQMSDSIREHGKVHVLLKAFIT